MALSNWDTMAWNDSGEPCVGDVVFPNGVELEIYKNWVYISDPKAWREGEGIDKPCIMEILSGELSYARITIFAARGPQDSIFVAAAYRDWSTKPETMIRFFGIGCYGFEGEEFVGVKPDTIDEFMVWLEKLNDTSVNGAFELPAFKSGKRYNQGDAYFAGRLGDATPASEAGQAPEPLLMKALKRIEGKDDNTN